MSCTKSPQKINENINTFCESRQKELSEIYF